MIFKIYVGNDKIKHEFFGVEQDNQGGFLLSQK